MQNIKNKPKLRKNKKKPTEKHPKNFVCSKRKEKKERELELQLGVNTARNWEERQKKLHVEQF